MIYLPVIDTDEDLLTNLAVLHSLKGYLPQGSEA